VCKALHFDVQSMSHFLLSVLSSSSFLIDNHLMGTLLNRCDNFQILFSKHGPRYNREFGGSADEHSSIDNSDNTSFVVTRTF
jgi:hypothetical protein